MQAMLRMRALKMSKQVVGARYATRLWCRPCITLFVLLPKAIHLKTTASRCAGFVSAAPCASHGKAQHRIHLFRQSYGGAHASPLLRACTFCRASRAAFFCSLFFRIFVNWQCQDLPTGYRLVSLSRRLGSDCAGPYCALSPILYSLGFHGRSR